MALEKNHKYDMTQEVGKYRKKKKKKTTKKADHKHVGTMILIHDTASKYGHICRGEYCEICGKILNTWYFETKKSENGWHTMMTQEEVLEKYKHLEIVDVHGIHDTKFIPIGKEIKEE